MERQLSLRSIMEQKTKEDCIQDFILHIYFHCGQPRNICSGSSADTMAA